MQVTFLKILDVAFKAPFLTVSTKPACPVHLRLRPVLEIVPTWPVYHYCWVGWADEIQNAHCNNAKKQVSRWNKAQEVMQLWWLVTGLTVL